MQTPTEKQDAHSSHWTLFRDLAVLQVKLLVDSFRDLILLPASVISVIVSVARSKNGVPGPEFYKLLVVGRESEHFIDLFGALRNAPPDVHQTSPFGDAQMDDIVSRVETFIVDEYKRGGVTAQAKSRIDDALERMRTRKERKEAGPRGPDPDN